MGKTRIAMTLLSTLAALVIIVHTAEEEYERAQRGLRARSLEVEVPSYEQAWRVLDGDAQLPETPQNNDWKNDSQDEMPKRRRTTRKRKRRPQIQSDEILPQERHELHSDVLPRNQEYFVTPPDMIRRRKKINRQDTKEQGESERWGDQIGVERPVRRRGHRRKRPTNADTWPRLSEFDGFRPHEAVPEVNVGDIKDHETFNDESVNATNNQENRGQVEEKHDKLPYMFNSEIDDEDYPQPQNDHKIIVSEPLPAHNDRSLSEFSLETLIKPISDSNLKLKREKVKEKTKNTISQREKALLKENEPIEPQALKAILKRSNGRSLSEILQQNNLSLSDLLQGREKALSLLKVGELTENHESKVNNTNIIEENNNLKHDVGIAPSLLTQLGTQEINNNKGKSEIDSVTEHSSATVSIGYPEDKSATQRNDSNDDKDNTSQGHTRRRFPFHVRRRLRTRPFNNTRKGQLSRDLLALASQKYQNNRNIQKSKEWAEFMPSNTKTRKLKVEVDVKTKSDSDNHVVSENNIISTTDMVEESTEQFQETDNTDIPTTELSYTDMNIHSFNAVEFESVNGNTPENDELITTANDETIPTTIAITSTEKIVTITQKPRILSHIRQPTLNASELRRQAFNNRLNKKRLKQKKLSGEQSHDGVINDVLGMGDLVPASEFIAKTHKNIPNMDDQNNFTTFEDFIVTESASRAQTRVKSTRPPSVRSSIIPKIQPYMSVTEDTAKFEIEEILNDTLTRARISRILKERNMTLSELVEHRERGSSHVHLADIFHNASKEPNPPEPFLSKSLIEPISRETYPLRALLEANLHDPKSNLDLNALNSNYLNIPVVMDFGNNVNENGENMGIMSLFSNISKSNENFENQKRINITNTKTPSNIEKTDDQKSGREGRILISDKGLVNWNDIVKLLHQNNNQTDPEESQLRVSSKSETLKKILLEEDDDGDSVIVFEDLQHLKDNNIAASNEENLEVKLLERIEDRPTVPVFNTSSNTRSVTVITASIIGLALVLFLLTYAAFKWQQQSKIIDSKQCTKDDIIPSPVFENRTAKNNSSTRSKSPMLTSNIYSINTLDTHAGADSPEYMWDSLRKPFQ